MLSLANTIIMAYGIEKLFYAGLLAIVLVGLVGIIAVLFELMKKEE